MGQGKVGAVAGTALFCLLMLHISEVARAAVYTVGDDQGWTFNVSSWPAGKSFRTGDVLVFKYSPLEQNVAAVDKVGYNWCFVPRGATVLNSGEDRMKLSEGTNYFISSLPGHCQMGVKISITAAA